MKKMFVGLGVLLFAFLFFSLSSCDGVYAETVKKHTISDNSTVTYEKCFDFVLENVQWTENIDDLGKIYVAVSGQRKKDLEDVSITFQLDNSLEPHVVSIKEGAKDHLFWLDMALATYLIPCEF